VDFRKEARHIQEFSAYLDASGMRAVATCPFVYKALSTQRRAPFGCLPRVASRVVQETLAIHVSCCAWFLRRHGRGQ